MNLRGTRGGHGGELEGGREGYAKDVNVAVRQDLLKTLNQKEIFKKQTVGLLAIENNCRVFFFFSTKIICLSVSQNPTEDHSYLRICGKSFA